MRVVLLAVAMAAIAQPQTPPTPPPPQPPVAAAPVAAVAAAVSQLVTTTPTTVAVTAETIRPVPVWSQVSQDTQTYVLRAGVNYRYSAANCPTLPNATGCSNAGCQAYPQNAGIVLTDTYWMAEQDATVTVGSPDFFAAAGSNNDPGPWCAKFLYADTSGMYPVAFPFACNAACILTVSTSDPLAAVRLSSVAGMSGAYIETMRVPDEVGRWAAAWAAVAAAASSGAGVTQARAALRAVEVSIAQAHGCRDAVSFRVLDGYFVYVTNGTPLVPAPAAAVVPSVVQGVR